MIELHGFTKREGYFWFSILTMSLTLAVLRIDHTRGQFFQAIAHVWVGLLLGPLIVDFKVYWRLLFALVPLTIVEIVCAISLRS